jgi:hypothetical protein
MYIPKNTPPARHRMSAKQRAKQTKAGIMLAFLVILICAVWAMWQADREPKEATSAEQLLQHDLAALWLWSDDQMKSSSEGAQWSIRWNVTGKEGAMEELNKLFFSAEQGNASSMLVQNEGKTITGVIPSYGGQLSISLTQADSHGEQIMVLFETSPSEMTKKNRLLQVTADVSAQIARISPAFTSSMKVQGYTDNSQAIQRLVRLSDAKSVDHYEDKGTISDMFYTRMLKSAIMVENGKTANFQIALHKETNSDQTSLTIGVPVITGEYSANTIESQ